MNIISDYIHTVKWFAIIPVIFLPVIFVFAIRCSIAVWKNKFMRINGKEAAKITEKLFDQSFILAMTICLLIATILLPIAGVNASPDKRQIRDKAQTYAIYIDGVKVDNDKIDIEKYSLKRITVNDEKEEIYIASRS